MVGNLLVQPHGRVGGMPARPVHPAAAPRVQRHERNSMSNTDMVDLPTTEEWWRLVDRRRTSSALPGPPGSTGSNRPCSWPTASPSPRCWPSAERPRRWPATGPPDVVPHKVMQGNHPSSTVLASLSHPRWSVSRWPSTSTRCHRGSGVGHPTPSTSGEWRWSMPWPSNRNPALSADGPPDLRDQDSSTAGLVRRYRAQRQRPV